jgi:hypothetical protein
MNKSLEELEKKIVIIERRGNGHGLVEQQTSEEIELIDKETEKRRNEWFARLRLARARKTDAWGHTTDEDMYDYTTQEEYDYELKQALSVPPEQRYQDRKEMLWFHDSNWSMRGLVADDGYGCGSHPNYPSKCTPECRYYAEEGRVEDSEVIESFERYQKPKIISYYVDNKGRIIYHYPNEQQKEKQNP